MFSNTNTFFFKIETLAPSFPSRLLYLLLLLLLLHGSPVSSAGYLSQRGHIQEPGSKLDLNQSLYFVDHSESEYDQAEAMTSLSLSTER